MRRGEHAERVAAVNERCSGRGRKRWTADRVIAAMLRWVDLYGEQPTSSQWSKTTSPEFPTNSTVSNVFGSWNAGIAAAGLTPMKPGRYRRALDWEPPPRPSQPARTPRSPERRYPKPPPPVVRRDPAPTLPPDSPLRRGESVRGRRSTESDDEESTNTPETNRAIINRLRYQ